LWKWKWKKMKSGTTRRRRDEKARRIRGEEEVT
jgi:hypothetical protein